MICYDSEKSIEYNTCEFLYDMNLKVMEMSYYTRFLLEIICGYEKDGKKLRRYGKVRCIVCDTIDWVRVDNLVHFTWRNESDENLCSKCCKYIKAIHIAEHSKQDFGCVYFVSGTANGKKWNKIGKTKKTNPLDRFKSSEVEGYAIKVLEKYECDRMSSIETFMLHYLKENRLLSKELIESIYDQSFISSFDGITEVFPPTDKFNTDKFKSLCKKFKNKKYLKEQDKKWKNKCETMAKKECSFLNIKILPGFSELPIVKSDEHIFNKKVLQSEQMTALKFSEKRFQFS